jgi:Tol biopolymer transport system component/DNA-binding winged helix-turn-helix (wHTH) protein
MERSSAEDNHSPKIRFGVFEFDPQGRELSKHGVHLRLQEQPIQILAALLEQPGQIVPREELERRLWPDGTFVEYEQSLNKAVNKLREALGDSANNPIYIETLARRGYRFVAPVEELAREPAGRYDSRDPYREPQQIPASDPAPASAPAKERRLLQRIRLAAALLVADRRAAAAWIAAGLLAVALAVTPFVYRREKPSEQRTVRFQIPPPGNAPFSDGDTPVLSPDGTRIAFSNGGRLFVRSMDSLAARELPETEGGRFPFWAPDGRHIAFFADGKLRKMTTVGGAASMVCDSGDDEYAAGGAWNRYGEIVFASGLSAPLMRVEAAGGAPVPVTRLNAARGDIAHRWPSFLPDGKHFLFTVYASGKGGIFLGSLDSGETVRLLPDETNAQYVEPGYILLSRGGDLVAQPFDTAHLQITGGPLPLAENVQEDPPAPISRTTLRSAPFAASGPALAYRTAATDQSRRLRWLDRKGSPLGDLGAPGSYGRPGISPDGRAAAVNVATDGYLDIWIFDMTRDASSRLTFGKSDRTSPVWSPDGTEIAFAIRGSHRTRMYRLAANGAGKEELVADVDFDGVINQWTNDGQHLISQDINGGLWAVPLSGSRKPFALVTGPFHTHHGNVSPDGKWIAYAGEETGRREIYIRSFPPQGGKWRISSAGGSWPKWRGDGRELFYLQGGTIMSVEVRTSAEGLQAGLPQVLFDVPGAYPYDVSRDGQKFLVNIPNQDPVPPQPITVVLNWPAGIKR